MSRVFLLTCLGCLFYNVYAVYFSMSRLVLQCIHVSKAVWDHMAVTTEMIEEKSYSKLAWRTST